MFGATDATCVVVSVERENAATNGRASAGPIVPEGAGRRRRASRIAGVAVRHQRHCPSRTGGGCQCTPSYQAQVWSARDNKPIRRTFRTLAEARAWRQESQVALRQGQLRAPSKTSLDVAASEWLAGARAGIVRTRSGIPTSPPRSAPTAQALNKHLLPTLGRMRLTAITPNQIQDLVDALIATGAAPSTVRNAILPLRAIYRRASNRDEVAINPTLKLILPAVRGRRDRVARPEEAEALIEAVPARDRALWATALYAGLRRGELLALRWANIELDQGLIRVKQSWDRVAGLVEPKSRHGRRRVPLSNTLRLYLIAHHLLQPGPADGFVFAGATGRPFDPVTVVQRARKAWTAAGLQRIGLHECRHTYAAFMIAAGVNAKALSTYMGHAASRSRSTATATSCPATNKKPPACSTPTSTTPPRPSRGEPARQRLVTLRSPPASPATTAPAASEREPANDQGAQRRPRRLSCSNTAQSGRTSPRRTPAKCSSAT